MYASWYKKKPKPKISYETHVCECGNHRFRYVTNLIFKITDGAKTACPDFNGPNLECTKCGTIYNRYGEKEGN